MSGWIYVLHFHKPLGHSRHYTGSTKRLRERLTVHAQGHGSRLTRELFKRGIGWTLGGLFQASNDWMRRIERLSKDHHQAAHFCRFCHRDAEADGGRYCPPAVLPYDPDNLPFEPSSRALLGKAKRIHIRYSLSTKEAMGPIKAAMKELMQAADNAVGFIPVGGGPRDWIETQIRTGRIVIARHGRRIIGYASFSQNHGRTQARIHQLTVDDAYRCQGIGRCLVDAVQLENPLCPLVCTVRSDLPANHFWQAMGFQPTTEAIHRTSGNTLIHYTRKGQ